jgi:hypothetical protein
LSACAAEEAVALSAVIAWAVTALSAVIALSEATASLEVIDLSGIGGHHFIGHRRFVGHRHFVVGHRFDHRRLFRYHVAFVGGGCWRYRLVPTHFGWRYRLVNACHPIVFRHRIMMTAFNCAVALKRAGRAPAGQAPMEERGSMLGLIGTWAGVWFVGALYEYSDRPFNRTARLDVAHAPGRRPLRIQVKS